MPSLKRYRRMRQTDFQLFGGSPSIVGYPENNQNSEGFSGTVLGKLKYDPETKDLKIVLDTESPQTQKDSKSPNEPQ